MQEHISKDGGHNSYQWNKHVAYNLFWYRFDIHYFIFRKQ